MYEYNNSTAWMENFPQIQPHAEHVNFNFL